MARLPRLSKFPDANCTTEEWPPQTFNATVEVTARYDCREPAAVGCSWRVWGRYSATVHSVPEMHERMWSIVEDAITGCDQSIIGEFRAEGWFHVYHGDSRTYTRIRYEKSTPAGTERWRTMFGANR